MKFLLLLFFIVFLNSCSTSKKVYWCGDHACVNQAEKESYFKKTMIIEVKSLTKKKEKKNISELDYIKKEFNIIDEDNTIIKKEIAKSPDYRELTESEKRKIAKEIRLEEKRIIKEQKALSKRKRKEEKKRLKKEKLLAKKIEKDIKKNKKSSTKRKVNNEKVVKSSSFYVNKSSFKKLAEEIKNKNLTKSYPDINLKD